MGCFLVAFAQGSEVFGGDDFSDGMSCDAKNSRPLTLDYESKSSTNCGIWPMGAKVRVQSV